MTQHLRTACFALLTGIAVGLAPPAATADVVPAWTGSATGTTQPGTGAQAGHSIDSFTGWSTYLGWYRGAGSHVLNSATGAFQGTATWTSFNGDALKVAYSGALAPSGNPGYPYSFTGVLNVVGGTEGLAHAKGMSTTWHGAYTGSPGSFFFTFEGHLNARNVAPRTNFTLEGKASFSNLNAGVNPNALVPYYGVGSSPLLGNVVETGSIRNLTGLIPIDATTFMFLGEVGPHPTLPGQPDIHVIATRNGNIYSTWTAIFTLKIVDGSGDAVFSGDGEFVVTGGTGSYKHANGIFRTVFSTSTVPHGADQALAAVRQCGQIGR